jgi:hypothetical protein
LAGDIEQFAGGTGARSGHVRSVSAPNEGQAKVDGVDAVGIVLALVRRPGGDGGARAGGGRTKVAVGGGVAPQKDVVSAIQHIGRTNDGVTL